MPKARIPSVETLKTAVSVGVGVSSLPQPVDDSDTTPSQWHDCTGYLVDQPDQASADDLADLTEALRLAKKAKKNLTQADEASLATLKNALKTEMATAKAARQAKKNKGK